MDPARAGQLAAAAGLDAAAVYGTDTYAEAAEVRGASGGQPPTGDRRHRLRAEVVSVLFGLGDPDTALQVRAAHQAAVTEVVGFLESVAGHGLRGHQGDGQRAQRIGTDGWIVAGFEHRTSRADDPQLHTHLVVPNLLHGADGKWSAVDAKEIYRHALTASYLYHAVLRGQLTQRLGLAWTAPVKGVAEIDGLPADLLGEFSTRRRQILTAMDTAGTSGPDAAQAACLATRPAKTTGVPERTLRDRWAARAAGGRLTGPGDLVGKVLGKRRPPPVPPLDQLTALPARAVRVDRAGHRVRPPRPAAGHLPSPPRRDRRRPGRSSRRWRTGCWPAATWSGWSPRRRTGRGGPPPSCSGSSRPPSAWPAT